MNELEYLLGQVDGMLAALDAKVQAAEVGEATRLQNELFRLMQGCFWTNSSGSFASDLESFRDKLKLIG